VSFVASRARLLREVVQFGIVGGVAFVVDVTVFNALRVDTSFWSAPLSHKPITAKVISVCVATLVAYAGNRHWTWRDRPRRGMRREVALYALLNVVGMVIAVGCLATSHYLMGLTSALADNVSANGVGLALGTAFRFWSYRRWVFPYANPADQTDEPRRTRPERDQ
jgi:putative flippase GtrA